MTNDDDNPYAAPSAPAPDLSDGSTTSIDADTVARLTCLRLGSQNKLRWFVIVLLGCLGLVTTVGLLRRDELFGAVYAGGGSLLLFVLASLGSRRKIRQTARSQMDQMCGEPHIQRFEATAEHLRVVTCISDGRVRWTAFKKWFEDDGVVVATVHDGLHYIIPVAQLAPELAETIRERLAAHATRV